MPEQPNDTKEARAVRHENREIKTEAREDTRDATRLHVPLAIVGAAILLTASIMASYYSVQKSMDEKFNNMQSNFIAYEAKMDQVLQKYSEEIGGLKTAANEDQTDDTSMDKRITRLEAIAK